MNFKMDEEKNPRPRHYLVRPNKALIPLIAIDELPPILRPDGLPLNLDAETIDKWSLARVGDVTNFTGQYKVSLSYQEFLKDKIKAMASVNPPSPQPPTSPATVKETSGSSEAKPVQTTSTPQPSGSQDAVKVCSMLACTDRNIPDFVPDCYEQGGRGELVGEE